MPFNKERILVKILYFLKGHWKKIIEKISKYGKRNLTDGVLRKYGKWKYKQHQICIRRKGNAENISTNLRRVKIQVWKTQVLIWRGGRPKYENVKRVYYVFPLACLTLN